MQAEMEISRGGTVLSPLVSISARILTTRRIRDQKEEKEEMITVLSDNCSRKMWLQKFSFFFFCMANGKFFLQFFKRQRIEFSKNRALD